MKTRLLTAIIAVLWTFSAISQNNVGINTNSPVSLLDVRGNGLNYDVFNASNDKVYPLDSIMIMDKFGHVGIGSLNTTNFNLLSVGSLPTAISPQLEIWQGDPAGPASLMLADINDVAGFNGCLNLYLLGNKKVQLQAQGTSYFTGGSLAVGITTPAALFDVAGQGISGDVMWAGNDKDMVPDSAMILSSIGFLGLGTKFPQERLHVNGAVVLGQPTSTPAAGSIYFNGTNFLGWDGSAPKVLDLQQDADWSIQNGAGGIGTNFNACPGPVSVSFPGYVAPIPLAEYGYLYVSNSMPPPPGTFQNLLLLDETTGAWDASQGYLISNWQGGGANLQFAQGIHNGDQSFKITKAGTLLPSGQGDGTTMVRYNPSGITDFPNQSRVSAFQVDFVLQAVVPNAWTPINFTVDASPPWAYDQHSEFTCAMTANALAPPENAYFTAAQDGFYQVNARVKFNIDFCEPAPEIDWMGGPVQVNPDSYVSIAIWTGILPPTSGSTNSYAIGNNLQIAYSDWGVDGVEVIKKLPNNNAPNVSDVIFLMQGQTISIWVYHTAITPMNIIQGHDEVYVTIHKIS